MIFEAPAALQPITVASPIPPSPHTATLDPGSTFEGEFKEGPRT